MEKEDKKAAALQSDAENTRDGVSEYLDSFAEQEQNSDNNAFLYSLEHLEEKDLTVVRRRPTGRSVTGHTRRKKLISNLISFGFAFICFGVFLYCCWQILIIFSNYRKSDSMYGDIADSYNDALYGSGNGLITALVTQNDDRPMQSYSEIMESGVTEDDPQDEKTGGYSVVSGSLKFQKLLVFLESLKKSNPDTYGYISIDGTKISFPVVQGDDNDYYLTHSFEDTVLKSGSIFADYRNSENIESNRNVVLYGHNLSNGGMFHQLTDYLDESFFNSKDITLSTFDGIYTFRVFSIYKTVSTGVYFRIWFSSDTEFLDFCRQEEEASIFHKDGITFDEDSVILTLSTCVSGTTDGRYAIHAVLIGVEN